MPAPGAELHGLGGPEVLFARRPGSRFWPGRGNVSPGANPPLADNMVSRSTLSPGGKRGRAHSPLVQYITSLSLPTQE